MAGVRRHAAGGRHRGADQPDRRLCGAEAARGRRAGGRRARGGQPGRQPRRRRAHLRDARPRLRAFLGRTPALAGIVRRDDRVRDAIRRQTLFLTRHPTAPAAADVEAIAAGSGARADACPARRRLIRHASHATRLPRRSCCCCPARRPPARRRRAPACPARPVDWRRRTRRRCLPAGRRGAAAGRLDVLAVGSGTVLGRAAAPEGSFPDRMAQDLRAACPGADIRLVVQGERGMTAAAMLAALRPGARRHRFALVVWQTGTVEAVRKLPPEEFARTLDAGAAVARPPAPTWCWSTRSSAACCRAHADLTPTARDACRTRAAPRHRAVPPLRADPHLGGGRALDLEKAPPAGPAQDDRGSSTPAWARRWRRSCCARPTASPRKGHCSGTRTDSAARRWCRWSVELPAPVALAGSGRPWPPASAPWRGRPAPRPGCCRSRWSPAGRRHRRRRRRSARPPPPRPCRPRRCRPTAGRARARCAARSSGSKPPPTPAICASAWAIWASCSGLSVAGALAGTAARPAPRPAAAQGTERQRDLAARWHSR